MIITRAPVRISLAGGGTDLPAYYEQFGGAVINTAIDKYFYVILNYYEKDTIQISSSDYSSFYRYGKKGSFFESIGMQLPLAILDHFGVNRGLSIFLASEIPPETGLGSSSTVTVAIIKAISTIRNLRLCKDELAELACYIELEKLGKPIGKQDQYASAFGGLNWIEFGKNKTNVVPLQISIEIQHRLEQNLMLFFLGTTHKSTEILTRQSQSTLTREKVVLESLHRVKKMTYDVKQALETGDLATFGGLLHQNWVEKKKFANGISNPNIDKMYDLAIHHGALGGKVVGAGGGGFLMIYCEPPYQSAVTEALEQSGLVRIDFHLDHLGARVLMNTGLSVASNLES
jgi:D-glycero-alpha-D-manno-heptose-7-phosphate kinase